MRADGSGGLEAVLVTTDGFDGCPLLNATCGTNAFTLAYLFKDYFNVVRVHTALPHPRRLLPAQSKSSRPTRPFFLIVCDLPDLLNRRRRALSTWTREARRPSGPSPAESCRRAAGAREPSTAASSSSLRSGVYGEECRCVGASLRRELGVRAGAAAAACCAPPLAATTT